jgi:ketosteroid isomerase-like protein
MIDALTARQWADGYGRAWVERDSELAVALFTEDASYTQTPFGPTFRGHDEIRRYWVEITADESDVEYQAGDPLVDGSRVAFEFWVTMKLGGKPVTLPGCVVVVLGDEGRCSQLREYWHQQDGVVPAFAGWGS